ncbi:ubiquitin-like domain-containing protein CIP73 isoform X3 [Rhodamnia argentea]|uniref:Ubiquitin-like domain-containing protein CIP73 isoform X3 n=1 Tax=Rhodamnia argentea TaxID=178133 RepID=A0ABM3H924_9MYRT|nr:ubiquitin-like domain-containing protein CIP73 isoform X3 [Rhodamnia argentea]
MGSNDAAKVPRINEAEASESTIEIKIKTLDSQTHSLRVNKQVSVPALKEQVASVTGVVSEQQRLICRGKVLMDDQLLSAYHVEDGHTLHLVVRQPVPPSSEGTPAHAATSHSHSSHVAPGVVIETFNLPDQGDGVPPEISRIVSAVLSSFGIANPGSSNEGRSERTSGASSTLHLGQAPSEQSAMRGQSGRWPGAFGLPTAISMGQPPVSSFACSFLQVMPDSLTTMSQCLSYIKSEFEDIGRGSGNNAQMSASNRPDNRDPTSASQPGTIPEGLPTPASLAEIMLSTRQMLIEQVAECLQLCASQLQNQGGVTDPVMRSSTQNTTMRMGVLFHYLGAYILELGRTAMTLRLGQTASEAVVNAGPAIYISPSGPNPLMPVPFQMGTSFGSIPVGSVHGGSSFGGVGAGFLPRRIDIQIRRGTAGSNANGEDSVNIQQPLAPRSAVSATTAAAANPSGENPISLSSSGASEAPIPSFNGESGVRVVPIRTMVAAVPTPFSRLSSDSPSNSAGIYYPLIGRFQHAGSVAGERGSHASSEQHPTLVETVQQAIPESLLHQQTPADPGRDGSSTTDLGRQEPSVSRSVNINIISSGGSQTDGETERQVPGSVVQFLRSLFPGGDIHVEGSSIDGTVIGSASQDAGTSAGTMNAPESENRPSEDGIFLSNLLHQIMPFISEHAAGSNPMSVEESNTTARRTAQDSSTEPEVFLQAESSDIETSCGLNDLDQCPPNAKRQKRRVIYHDATDWKSAY